MKRYIICFRARGFDGEFTVLRAHALAGPESGKCFSFVRREMFLIWVMFFFLRARARSWRAPNVGMFFFRAHGRHAAPRQARPRPGAAPGVLRAVQTISTV